MGVPTGEELTYLGIEIDMIPELSGAGIGYIGGGACTVLRHSQHDTGLETFVLLQEKEVPYDARRGPPPPALAPKPNIGVELVGVGLNCAGAVLSWSVLAASASAVPVSGGASAALTVLAWSATVSTTAQCGLSIVRSVDIITNDGEWTAWLDSKDGYVWLSYALDAMSLAGAAASASASIRAAQAVRRATNRPFMEILKGMNRAERKRLTQEIIRLQYPGISNKAMKELIRMGSFPTRFGAIKVTKALFMQLRDAISASLTVSSSSVAGNLNLLYVSVYQE